MARIRIELPDIRPFATGIGIAGFADLGCDLTH